MRCLQPGPAHFSFFYRIPLGLLGSPQKIMCLIPSCAQRQVVIQRPPGFKYVLHYVDKWPCSYLLAAYTSCTCGKSKDMP